MFFFDGFDENRMKSLPTGGAGKLPLQLGKGVTIEDVPGIVLEIEDRVTRLFTKIDSDATLDKDKNETAQLVLRRELSAEPEDLFRTCIAWTRETSAQYKSVKARWTARVKEASFPAVVDHDSTRVMAKSYAKAVCKELVDLWAKLVIGRVGPSADGVANGTTHGRAGQEDHVGGARDGAIAGARALHGVRGAARLAD